MNFHDVIRKLVTGGAFSEEERAEALAVIDNEEQGGKSTVEYDKAPEPAAYGDANPEAGWSEPEPSRESEQNDTQQTGPIAP